MKKTYTITLEIHVEAESAQEAVDTFRTMFKLGKDVSNFKVTTQEPSMRSIPLTRFHDDWN